MTRIFVGMVGEMEKGTARTVEADGESIALFRNDDGEFYATADSCTHEQWSLGEDGDLEQNHITCPLHMAQFDIRSGAALCLPATEALKTYPVTVEDDRVLVII